LAKEKFNPLTGRTKLPDPMPFSLMKTNFPDQEKEEIRGEN